MQGDGTPRGCGEGGKEEEWGCNNLPLASYSNCGCLEVLASNLMATSRISAVLSTEVPRYMSPNEPDHIFLPSRHLPPMRSSAIVVETEKTEIILSNEMASLACLFVLVAFEKRLYHTESGVVKTTALEL
jgi:hypothetical protein